MALIGSIRERGWILISLMALALGGFILMDVISNSQRYAQGDINSLGMINGQEIKRAEFETYQKLIYGDRQADPYQVRTQVWEHFVETKLVGEQAEALGLGVCKDELRELQFGTNLSPIIQQRFGNPQTGQINMEQLLNIQNAIDQGQFTDPTNRAYWAEQEKEIISERLKQKVMNMVGKAMYTPAWMAEMVYRENNERLDYRSVRVGFEQVKDEEAVITDADFKSYLSENPKLYSQPEELRSLVYVQFDVVPTAADSASAREEVTKLLEGLRNATNDSAYVASNEGVVEENYRRRTDLPQAIAALAVGSVSEPYLEVDKWTISKILDQKIVPDSVKARHILLQPGTPENSKKIDSLLALLTAKRATFDSLAARNGTDATASKGGDLGWFAQGMMVPEFNSLCFYKAEQGKYYKVQTQFGWHLLEVTGKKFLKSEPSVKIASIARRVEPSKSTQQAAKDRATAFQQKCKTVADLESNAKAEGLNVQPTPGVKANDFQVGLLGGGDDSRNIVQWAFNPDTKLNGISGEVFGYGDLNGGYFDSRYVVVGLKNISPKGEPSLASIKAMPDVELRVKNRKKGEVLKAKLQNASDLAAIAAQYNTKVDSIKNFSFGQGGPEPRVTGAVFGTATNAVSAPIVGVNGVYLVSPLTEKSQLQAPPDLTPFRRQAASTALSSLRMSFWPSLKKAAEIKDNRSRFF